MKKRKKKEPAVERETPTTTHKNRINLNGVTFIIEGDKMTPEVLPDQKGEYRRLPVMVRNAQYFMMPFPCVSCETKCKVGSEVRIWVHRVPQKAKPDRWITDPMCKKCQEQIVKTPHYHPYEYHLKIPFPLMWLPRVSVVKAFDTDMKLADLWSPLVNLTVREDRTERSDFQDE